MSNLTSNERELLIAIRDNEFHDGNHPVNEYVWVDCIWGWEGTSKYAGTMASLVKKQLAKTDGECCCITQAGFDAVREV